MNGINLKLQFSTFLKSEMDVKREKSNSLKISDNPVGSLHPPEYFGTEKFECQLFNNKNDLGATQYSSNFANME